ncbi:hypothetical protein SBV1_210016 [Verrucomicrobia bacterium]|nr:hypothetical protein SBV1_210016 [Verrucomicrobiota bacterium]
MLSYIVRIVTQKSNKGMCPIIENN